MDIWEIKLNSDECQYCEPPFQPDGDYLCKHPGGNWGKECIEEMCPVASQPAVEADAQKPCSQCIGQKEKIGKRFCAICGRDLRTA